MFNKTDLCFTQGAESVACSQYDQKSNEENTTQVNSWKTCPPGRKYQSQIIIPIIAFRSDLDIYENLASYSLLYSNCFTFLKGPINL